jgi:hypothetical protein
MKSNIKAYVRGFQPGGRANLGGLERYESSGRLGTFVPVGDAIDVRGTEEL